MSGANDINNSDDTRSRLARVKLLALDVDGTLTDGGIFYDNAGGESRRFDIKDGLGMVMCQSVGLRIAWITGRNSPLVARRAKELGVAILQQGVRDKADALALIAADTNLTLDEIAFMGDDLNDLPALRTAGCAMAVGDAVAEVHAAAHWRANRPGGHGAVREAIEAILRARGDDETAVAAYVAALCAPARHPLQ